MTSKQDAAAGLVLGYESFALLSGGKLPTISELCVRHRWLSAVTVSVLVVHLVQSDMAHTGADWPVKLSGWLRWQLYAKNRARQAVERMERKRRTRSA